LIGLTEPTIKLDKIKATTMISCSIPLEVTPQQIISAVKRLDKAQQEALLEDLLAALSPAYLESIRETREQYQLHEVVSHDEMFNEI